MFELPPLGVSETVLPLTALFSASFSVTVIVDAATPSAVTEAGLALTVDVVAETAPGLTVKLLLVPVIPALPPIPVAVIVKFPVFVMVTL